MDILIVGNGFDLSHYLPTKYDHFMDVMGAIENKNTGGLPPNLDTKDIDEWLSTLNDMFERRGAHEDPPHHMSFEELFSQTRDPKFIEKTKEYYQTENIILSTREVLELQYRLAKNCWYKYFKDHVKEIKTWIDFENKIKEGLETIFNFIRQFDQNYLEFGSSQTDLYLKQDKELKRKSQLCIAKLQASILDSLGLIKLNPKHGKIPKIEGVTNLVVDSRIACMSSLFKVHERNEYGLDEIKYINYLQNELENFIKIFNLYLELVIDKLESKYLIEIIKKNWIDPSQIFSFNYTNTYQKFYKGSKADFLHGKFGSQQNIVLGISDLEDEYLKKLKGYGFTKYHQKLFKDTDYLFIDNYKKKVAENLYHLKNHESTNYETSDLKLAHRKRWISNGVLNLNIHIWGHSLDYSDKEYIVDLFLLNDEMDRKVKLTIYYFDRSAKFALLNNLLSILEKDKVEHWMKNKWLTFEPNPEIRFTDDVPLAGN